MKKKIVIAILCMAATLSLSLAGCGKEETENEILIQSQPISEASSEASSEGAASGTDNIGADAAKEAEALYDAFLNGTEVAYFDRLPQNDHVGGPELDPQKGYTLEEVKKALPEVFENSNADIAICHALIDCGNDGVKELAVQFQGLGIYSPEDDSTLVYVFKAENGKLHACLDFATWARSYTGINQYGFIDSFGSSGASEHGGYYGILDADCNYHDVYSFWESYVLMEETEQANLPGYIVYETVTIDGTEYAYYVIDGDDDNDKYAKLVRDAGYNVLPEEEVHALEIKALEKLGITEEMKNAPAPF